MARNWERKGQLLVLIKARCSRPSDQELGEIKIKIEMRDILARPEGK
jgi:hypothetical protein